MQRRHFLLHVPLAAAGASAAALALGGCGFHLREAPVLAFHSIYIEGDPKSVIVSRLRRLLAPQVRIVTEAAHRNEADVILQILSDRQEQVAVARWPTAQVLEVELRVLVDFALVTPGGKELIARNTLKLSRDVSYNETQTLSKDEEFATLYRDMRIDAVQQILRRLGAVRSL